MKQTVISATNFADIMGVSKRTLNVWKESGKYTIHKDTSGQQYLYVSELMKVPEV